MRTFGCLFAALTIFAACSTPQRLAATPGEVDGPVNCEHEQFKAHEQCFDHAQAACDSLHCAHGCEIHRARSSKWVLCSFNEASSSNFTKCAGFSGWECPENTTCVMPPGSEQIDDAAGNCEPKTTRP
jgi:hypothetical protein